MTEPTSNVSKESEGEVVDRGCDLELERNEQKAPADNFDDGRNYEISSDEDEEQNTDIEPQYSLRGQIIKASSSGKPEQKPKLKKDGKGKKGETPGENRDQPGTKHPENSNIKENKKSK